MLLQLPVDDHVGRVHSYPSSVAFFCDLPASASIQAGGDVFVYGGCHGDVSIAINAPSANQSSPSPFVTFAISMLPTRTTLPSTELISA
jgi:hypothetical protein